MSPPVKRSKLFEAGFSVRWPSWIFEKLSIKSSGVLTQDIRGVESQIEGSWSGRTHSLWEAHLQNTQHHHGGGGGLLHLLTVCIRGGHLCTRSFEKFHFVSGSFPSWSQNAFIFSKTILEQKLSIFPVLEINTFPSHMTVQTSIVSAVRTGVPGFMLPLDSTLSTPEGNVSGKTPIDWLLFIVMKIDVTQWAPGKPSETLTASKPTL